MESKCIFCEIGKGNIKALFVYSDKNVFAINDINPKAKTHILVIPRVHIKSFSDIYSNQYELLTKSLKVVQRLVKAKNLESSYRVLINGGSHQEVDHIHIHLLSEKKLVN